MRVVSLQLRNFKCYSELSLDDFGSVNVFVGENNSGKSTLLQALQAAQEGWAPRNDSIRAGETEGEIRIGFDGVGRLHPLWRDDPGTLNASIALHRTQGSPVFTLEPHGLDATRQQLPSSAPHHTLVPLMNRRPAIYNEDVNIEAATRLQANWQNLPAWVDRATSPGHALGEEIMSLARELYGTRITAIPARNGKTVGTFLDADLTIPIDQMGGGVAHGVPLLLGLKMSEGKIILIEEPETDLHPGALRRLLEVIEDASKSNQLFVTTHAPQALEHLGAIKGARLFEVRLDKETKIPTASVAPVAPHPSARAEVLGNLGARLSDVGLFDGWLILEEATAERIINTLLVPWFVPALEGRLRTVSATGISQVEPTFSAYLRLFIFLHLEEHYRHKAWVAVDGDAAGTEVISRLKNTFSDRWPATHFRTWTRQNFEDFYPEKFTPDVVSVMDLPKRDRLQGKVDLMERVLAWAQDDGDQARQEFETSAAEVIELLHEIAAALENTDSNL